GRGQRLQALSQARAQGRELEPGAPDPRAASVLPPEVEALTRLRPSEGGSGRVNFDISTEQLGDDAYVIALSGEVDLYTAPEFKQQLLDVIGKGAKDVIVDFSKTTFIDSTTLGVLVGGVKRLRPNEGQLSLVCSDRHIT